MSKWILISSILLACLLTGCATLSSVHCKQNSLESYIVDHSNNFGDLPTGFSDFVHGGNRTLKMLPPSWE